MDAILEKCYQIAIAFHWKPDNETKKEMSMEMLAIWWRQDMVAINSKPEAPGGAQNQATVYSISIINNNI